MRDSYTNRNHCPSHEMWSYERMVVGEGGRSSRVLLYFSQHSIFTRSSLKLENYSLNSCMINIVIIEHAYNFTLY